MGLTSLQFALTEWEIFLGLAKFGRLTGARLGNYM